MENIEKLDDSILENIKFYVQVLCFNGCSGYECDPEIYFEDLAINASKMILKLANSKEEYREFIINEIKQNSEHAFSDSIVEKTLNHLNKDTISALQEIINDSLSKAIDFLSEVIQENKDFFKKNEIKILNVFSDFLNKNQDEFEIKKLIDIHIFYRNGEHKFNEISTIFLKIIFYHDRHHIQLEEIFNLMKKIIEYKITCEKKENNEVFFMYYFILFYLIKKGSNGVEIDKFMNKVVDRTWYYHDLIIHSFSMTEIELMELSSSIGDSRRFFKKIIDYVCSLV